MLRLHSLWFLLLLAIGLAAQSSADGVQIITEQIKFQESHPQITPDGQLLYFTRNRHPRNQGSNDKSDIWLRQKQADGSWGRALNAAGPINSFADDQLIGLSADGRRLAVLRSGVANMSLDILQKGERSWKILQSLSLDDLQPVGLTACFNVSNNELIYSRLQNGQYDLFRRQLLPTQGWGPEETLGLLNSAQDERAPYVSPDGMSLYFRRGAVWYQGHWLPARSTFGADSPMLNIIPADHQHIAIAVEPQLQLVGATQNDNSESRLLLSTLAPSTQLPVGKIIRGVVGAEASQLATNELSIDVLANQRKTTLYPDRAGNYSIVVPQQAAEIELLTPGYFLSDRAQLSNKGSSTSTTANLSPDDLRRHQSIQKLNQEIAITTTEVARLQQKRKALSEKVRKEQLAAGQEVLAGYIDPELAKLRSQVITAQINLNDTIPPDTALIKKPTIRRKDNAAAIDELTALRNRFKAAKRALGDDNEADWTANDPVAVRKSAARQLNEEVIPTISQEIAQSVYAQQQIDSVAMEQNIRGSLFATNRPAVYEREPWENELIENIEPAAKKVLRERLQAPIENSALADQALQQQLYDQELRLQQLRDSLDQQLAAQTAIQPNTNQPTTYSAPVAEPEPFTANNALAIKGGSALQPPFPTGRSVTLAQLRFGPNSDLIKPRSTEELDRLALQLKQDPQSQAIIGVHASGSLDSDTAQRLTDQRAASIINYLTQQGVLAQQISAIGYGRQQPIADNNTPEGRLRNQRIEVQLK